MEYLGGRVCISVGPRAREGAIIGLGVPSMKEPSIRWENHQWVWTSHLGSVWHHLE